MTMPRPRVFVSVHGRFHAFELSAELARHRVLAGVATTYPTFIARRFLPRDTPLYTAPFLEAARRVYARLPNRLTRAHGLDPWLAERFGRFIAEKLPKDIDVLIAWSGGAKEIIPRAHERGVKVMLERGSTHIAHQAEVLNAAFREFGMTAPAVPLAMIEREMAEYDAVDAISVPTRYAARTFTERGVPEDKVFVNPYGVELSRFFRPKTDDNGQGGRPVRILFVGRVDIRKGIPWLLRAFAPLAKTAELHVVGPVPKDMRRILDRESLINVKIHGPVPSTALPELYKSADIFCLPSLEEGFALVLLQAMAAGLPVVASDVSGAENLIVPGEHGYLVPPRESAALSDKLSMLIQDGARRSAMGSAARKRVEAGYTWRDYGDRAVELIRKLVS
ncbi:MAG: glycosyltransferase family 4 protein [Rhodospirillales bacterium]